MSVVDADAIRPLGMECSAGGASRGNDPPGRAETTNPISTTRITATGWRAGSGCDRSYRFAIAFCVVMMATAATMMADATSVRELIGSPSTSQPRNTATIGLTYA